MPPKAKFTKQALVDAAIALIREHGIDALSARNLGTRLGCSSRPIFTLYKSMNELQHDVLIQAYAHYRAYIDKETASQTYPPYKASGMAYIRFAVEEKELFKFLFMRERSKEEISADFGDPMIVERILQANPTLTTQQASQLYLSMWIHSHGIATMLVTAYYSITMDEISEQLTLAYLSIRDQILKKGLPT